MATMLALGILLSPPQVQVQIPRILEGDATYMNPGLIEPHCVALNDCREKGRSVYIYWIGPNVVTGPHPVTDCAQRGAHFELREEQGRVVEVSAQVAQQIGFWKVGPVPVKVAYRLTDFLPPGVPRWN